MDSMADFALAMENTPDEALRAVMLSRINHDLLSEVTDFIMEPKKGLLRRLAVAYLMGGVLASHKREYGQISHDQLIRAYRILFEFGSGVFEKSQG